MSESDLIRLRHMLDAARDAVQFGAGRNSSDLARDRVLALALVRCIEIIGEAASKVSPEVRVKFPEVPWADIIGMRNRLIHAYFEVDLNRRAQRKAKGLPGEPRNFQGIQGKFAQRFEDAWEVLPR